MLSTPWLAATEQPIFIHCQQGISRSASALSAFLLEESKDSVEKTIDLLRTHRRCINPNLGFVAQLLTFQKSLPPSPPSEPTVQPQSSMPFADRNAANSEAAEIVAQPPQL
ncbi:dual specificity protein phosphatase family protein [Piscirickettsia salmonis]|uniref:dual specificity protein phosphatase family protein n=1 Tax=Piscirickettsia salmonis TaxID=1238 RepID=UPI00094AE065|nr:dual specificity protein phosphatase [Piscirickettsia salmonis]QNR79673.1 dual specificity protein phosphatase family protein [Piscirickettsia salmonis]WGZ71239.1 hypothetical protein E3220_06060 [Piscirickettsia salmonis EM-90]